MRNSSCIVRSQVATFAIVTTLLLSSIVETPAAGDNAQAIEDTTSGVAALLVGSTLCKIPMDDREIVVVAAKMAREVGITADEFADKVLDFKPLMARYWQSNPDEFCGNLAAMAAELGLL